MVAGFTTLAIKDGAGNSQNLAVYADAGGTLYPAPTGTDALGDILGLAANPIASNLYAGGTAIALGQGKSTASIPVTLAAPTVLRGATFTRPANTTAYAFGQTIANSVTAGSVTPMPFAICPANGVPVYIIKARIYYQTSGNAGIALTAGQILRLHLFGQSPTVAAGDGATFSNTMVNWMGTLTGSFTYDGTDWSVGELAPDFASFVECNPAGGSSTIYGLLESRGAWTPTSGGIIFVDLIEQ